MTITPTAHDVLDFVDEFAGQEDTAEDVRDFVQTAARFIAQGKTAEEWEADPVLFSIVEWVNDRGTVEAVNDAGEGAR